MNNQEGDRYKITYEITSSDAAEFLKLNVGDIVEKNIHFKSVDELNKYFTDNNYFRLIAYELIVEEPLAREPFRFDIKDDLICDVLMNIYNIHINPVLINDEANYSISLDSEIILLLKQVNYVHDAGDDNGNHSFYYIDDVMFISVGQLVDDDFIDVNYDLFGLGFDRDCILEYNPTYLFKFFDLDDPILSRIKKPIQK